MNTEQTQGKLETRPFEVRSEVLFGLRVVGRQDPLPHFFATEAEAKELRMRHRDHSPACLEVVRITVEPNAAGQWRREAPYPEPDGSAFDSEEPDDREERCDSCGETSRCLMNGLCPMCYELNGGTHD